jgi:hypothetical protein
MQKRNKKYLQRKSAWLSLLKAVQLQLLACWFEVSPLGLRKTGVVYGVFHASTEAALKMSRQTPSRMSTYLSTNLSPTVDKSREIHTNPENRIIQTGSY